MKIERVSENQLKLTLTRADLTDRDLRLEDLINPSEKTQQLFRDIMEQALVEYDFVGENAPLMVEAVPAGTDGLTIIVTKMDGENKPHGGVDMLSQAKELRKWKKKPMEIPKENKGDGSNPLIYSFEALDDAINASLKLNDCYQGDSSFFKNDGKFFLVLQGDTYSTEDGTESLELVLEEYGEKHISSSLAKYYLVEHGETMISQHAVKVLAKI